MPAYNSRSKPKPKPKNYGGVTAPTPYNPNAFGPGWLDAWQKQSDAIQQKNAGIKPPAPKPPPAPPPKPQALPFDPLFESENSNAQLQYDTTISNLAYQEGRVKADYGFDDASDPFSRAKMLERNFHQSQRGRLNTAGNNLYSSSFNRGEEQGRFGYEQNLDTTRKSYADALQALQQQKLQAGVDRTTTQRTAGAERIYRAQQDRDSQDPGPPPPSPAPKPKPKPKAKKKPAPKKKGPKKKVKVITSFKPVKQKKKPLPRRIQRRK